MDKETALQKIEWLQKSLSTLKKVVSDGDDPNCKDAHNLVDVLEKDVSEWMNAHYGDGDGD